MTSRSKWTNDINPMEIPMTNKISNFILNHNTFNILKSFIFYPYYRIFIENKIIGTKQFRKGEFFPIKAAIISSLKSRNGYFSGAASFFISTNLAYCFAKIIDMNIININKNDNTPHILFLLPCFIISYPFLINSNRKILNDSNYLMLRNPINLIKLIFNKRNYRGLVYHLLSSIIYYIPIANLFSCNKLESIRFTYVFGKNEKGISFINYGEAKKFINNNSTFTKGRSSFNKYMIGYYIAFGILFYEEYRK